MRRERIERANVVVGKEWLRVEMSQDVCVVVTGDVNGEQKGGLECKRATRTYKYGLAECPRGGFALARRSIAW